ncbi:hypothetical protein Tco_1280802 [Tanacetum coccineum]
MDPAIVMCKNSGHGEDGEKIMELGTMDMDGSATEKMDNRDDEREGDEGTRLKIKEQRAAPAGVATAGAPPSLPLPPTFTIRSSMLIFSASLANKPSYTGAELKACQSMAEI